MTSIDSRGIGDRACGESLGLVVVGATTIPFPDGKAIEMRQFKSREEALAAAAPQS